MTSRFSTKASGHRLKLWRKAFWLICAVLLYLAYTYFGGSSGLIQLWRLKQRHSDLQQDITMLQATQDSLKQVIHRLQHDTTYIEKVARERFQMGRPGETIYTIVKQPAAGEDKKQP
ncbi:MAG: septum formation initiator family protein [candidate division KSB1 bacterium]|nr:septum formation initiator family protein [candidate division KSB1 bacterium]MDZ7272836.1 septum formation initiator family protein [candidate division KSB1 bacterium]MDZ7284141.1 septum formation initiator family protein [candidate division KSB1 bacterium]MDZ7297461.1 septum formation initiator family protein [candidate division KSB1 bacterium]MDZ7305597.1 septum formation initiator family protein [candidate division KSB1 bacterium]